MKKLNQAIKQWYDYDGFALAHTREEQIEARIEQKRLADIVVNIAKNINL